MHILITNDDGIDAPGLAAIEAAVRQFGTLTVVAPHREYSGCGHQVTNDEPFRIERTAERRYKVFGTPADCTRIGLTKLAPAVDLVLSGINEGGNLGVDVVMSGTVAAAREAVWLGTPSIAFSQYVRRGRERDWRKTTAMARRVFTALKTRSTPPTGFWNVNMPDVDTHVDELLLVDTFVEPAHLPVGFDETDKDSFSFRSDYRNRPRAAGSDVDVCFGGAISISHVAANP